VHQRQQIEMNDFDRDDSAGEGQANKGKE